MSKEKKSKNLESAQIILLISLSAFFILTGVSIINLSDNDFEYMSENLLKSVEKAANQCSIEYQDFKYEGECVKESAEFWGFLSNMPRKESSPKSCIQGCEAMFTKAFAEDGFEAELITVEMGGEMFGVNECTKICGEI